ncbi:MAG: glycoside hydrolase family 97 protein [Vicinamibacteria bacterium]
MTRSVVAVLALVSVPAAAHTLKSPDGRIAVEVRADGPLRYDVTVDGKTVVKDASLALTIDGVALGATARVKGTKTRSVDTVHEPAVRRKSASIRERFHELRLELDGRYAVAFRAFDDGVAYRFETSLAKPSVVVKTEEARIPFVGARQVYYPREDSFFSHNERHYLPVKLESIAPAALATLPAVVELEAVKIALAESDVEDYPGLWLRGNSDQSLSVTFPPYPLETRLDRDRDLSVVKGADFIAKTKGKRTYPWRILAVARTDAELVTNELVWLLASPSRVADTSWIRPGKVAWDWYNASNLKGVPFKAGINTETYKYFIDFASKHGIEYVVLDEGWYVLGDLSKVVPEIDMEALSAYAQQKNVGLIMWVVWNTFDDQFLPTLDRFVKWGVRGIKIDFMQRDDQPVMEYYHRVSREAAARRMLVDFHGAQRPALLTRTWPNLISTEGVKGLENVKWSEDVHPEHDLTLPFTRMLLGPMDYTPGAMSNAAKGSFAKIFLTPMSMGTRSHQLALYVAFESPLQMLADAPTAYEREPESLEFLSAVPSVWDETRVLHAQIGDFLAIARRRGSDWYVGALTDWTPRELAIDLSFLGPGEFVLDAYADGPNAERQGSDYVRSKRDVDATAKLTVRLAPGGGWAARVTPKR